MDDKNKDKEQILDPERNAEEAKDEAREIADEVLEGVAGGTTPIIRPF